MHFQVDTLWWQKEGTLYVIKPQVSLSQPSRRFIVGTVIGDTVRMWEEYWQSGIQIHPLKQKKKWKQGSYNQFCPGCAQQINKK